MLLALLSILLTVVTSGAHAACYNFLNAGCGASFNCQCTNFASCANSFDSRELLTADGTCAGQCRQVNFGACPGSSACLEDAGPCHNSSSSGSSSSSSASAGPSADSSADGPIPSPGAITFPKYLQCDPKWANNTMGTRGDGERSTICGEGCAMSCTAMALAGLGVMFDNSTQVTPATLNSWLEHNSGYLCLAGDCNNLNLTAPEILSFRMTLIGEQRKGAFHEVVLDIAAGSIVHIAHVRNNSHFVLLTGQHHHSAVNTFTVHDPYYPVSTYKYDDVSDIIRYKVNRYPLYKQCDPRWANNVMGQNGDTICDVGCLMSSISMAMHGTGNILINGSAADPATLNAWLRENNGYDAPSSALFEDKIPLIDPTRIVWPADGMHPTNDIPLATIRAYLDRKVPRIVIANVMQGQHFVLVTGYRADNDTLVINDPGFNRATYSYSNDVVGWRIFDMFWSSK